AGLLYGRAPDPIAGLIEARGVGVVNEPCVWVAKVALVMRCAAGAEAIDRLPDRAIEVIAGIAVPALKLRALDASAPAKMRRAIEHLGRGEQQAYLAPSLGGQNRAGTGDTA
ncbi:MAG TPA: hypothetical protein VMU37_03260, partial [Caulobacteraceae bacterium]|nr:hypothetical protein [Caulobacteraceae bacterium]